MSEKVKVAVRCRPKNENEKKKKVENVIKVDESRREIFIFNSVKNQKKTFTFDYVYGFNSKQSDIYEDCAYGIVESVIEGYNGTIFAYGQTGTGKTFTMEGLKNDDILKGIIPRAFKHIYNTIQGTEDTEFLVCCSMLELYNEEVFDLLGKRKDEKLDVHEKPGSGFYVKNLTVHNPISANECMKMLQRGSKNRKKAATEMNKDSSRSHCIFSINIETSIKDDKGESLIRKGKLNLVDLAGSERQKKTKVGGKHMKEAQKINFSLVCLGKVIKCLVKRSKFIPYRDSKLTKLLMDSLGGNTKTVMITNIGPSFENYEETLCSLRYANEAKMIKNKPKINEDPKDAKLRKIQSEITKLKEYLRNAIGSKAGKLLEGNITENMKSQVLRQIIYEEGQINEKYREETEKIMKMKQISEVERKKLLDELRIHEKQEIKEREEKKKLLEKISVIKEKILKGNKQKEEFLRVQKELHKKREEKKLIQQKKIQMNKQAEDAEIEKGLLEKKYVSQKEELRAKKELGVKVESRFLELKAEHDEFIESYELDLNNLIDENKDLESQTSLNNLIINNYFDSETISKLDASLYYTPYYDMFKIKETIDSQLKELYDSFIHMKGIQEKNYKEEIDTFQENFLLFGYQNSFQEFKA